MTEANNSDEWHTSRNNSEAYRECHRTVDAIEMWPMLISNEQDESTKERHSLGWWHSSKGDNDLCRDEDTNNDEESRTRRDCSGWTRRKREEKTQQAEKSSFFPIGEKISREQLIESEQRPKRTGKIAIRFDSIRQSEQSVRFDSTLNF